MRAGRNGGKEECARRGMGEKRNGDNRRNERQGEGSLLEKNSFLQGLCYFQHTTSYDYLHLLSYTGTCPKSSLAGL
jgi:hypothetical protein